MPACGRALLFFDEIVTALLVGYSARHATVRLKCPCTEDCSCWLSAAEVAAASKLKSRIPCGCGGRAVDVWMVDPRPDVVEDARKAIAAAEERAAEEMRDMQAYESKGGCSMRCFGCSRC